MKNIQTVSQYINDHEFKKAEISIARHLRDVPESQHVDWLFLRIRLRLLTARPEDALSDVEELGKIPLARSQTYQLREYLANAYLLRFELASIGFASREDVQQAEHLYRGIIAENPTYPNLGWIHYQLARISLILDRAYAAEKHLYEALFTPSDVHELTAFCYERLGFIAFYEARQPHRALTFLNKAIQTYPHNNSHDDWLTQSRLLRSRILREIEPDRAITEAEKILLDTPRDSVMGREVVLLLAELYTSSEQGFDRVIAVLQSFLQNARAPSGVDVAWSRAYEMLGDAFMQQQQYLKAIDAFRQSLVYNPYHPWAEDVQYRIGLAYLLEDDHQQAIDYLVHLIDDYDQIEDPKDVENLRRYQHLLQRACEQSGDLETLRNISQRLKEMPVSP